MDPAREGVGRVRVRLTVHAVGSLDNVLGTVKRVDQDENCYLVGIEFIGRDYLLDRLSEGEMQMLSENLSDFTQTVHDVLKKYIYRERVVSHGE